MLFTRRWQQPVTSWAAPPIWLAALLFQLLVARPAALRLSTSEQKEGGADQVETCALEPVEQIENDLPQSGGDKGLNLLLGRTDERFERAETALRQYQANLSHVRACATIQDRTNFLAPLVIPKLKLAFCYVPKVACTQFKDLFNNLNGLKASEGFGNDYLRSTPKMLGFNRSKIKKESGWKFAVFTRDPALRYLSAFGSTCVSKTNHSTFEHRFECCGPVITDNTLPQATIVKMFEERVAYDLKSGVIKQDDHWASQVAILRQCSWDWFNPANVDFHGHLHRDMNEQVKAMLKMVNASEKQMEVVNRLFPKDHIAGHMSPLAKVSREAFFENPTTIKSIQKIYEDDYQKIPQVGCSFTEQHVTWGQEEVERNFQEVRNNPEVNSSYLGIADQTKRRGFPYNLQPRDGYNPKEHLKNKSSASAHPQTQLPQHKPPVSTHPQAKQSQDHQQHQPAASVHPQKQQPQNKPAASPHPQTNPPQEHKQSMSATATLPQTNRSKEHTDKKNAVNKPPVEPQDLRKLSPKELQKRKRQQKYLEELKAKSRPQEHKQSTSATAALPQTNHSQEHKQSTSATAALTQTSPSQEHTDKNNAVDKPPMEPEDFGELSPQELEKIRRRQKFLEEWRVSHGVQVESHVVLEGPQNMSKIFLEAQANETHAVNEWPQSVSKFSSEARANESHAVNKRPQNVSKFSPEELRRRWKERQKRLAEENLRASAGAGRARAAEEAKPQKEKQAKQSGGQPNQKKPMEAQPRLQREVSKKKEQAGRQRERDAKQREAHHKLPDKKVQENHHQPDKKAQKSQQRPSKKALENRHLPDKTAQKNHQPRKKTAQQ